MNWTIGVKMWIGILFFVVLSAVVFYSTYVVEQKSLIVSLFGFFFVLVLGIFALMLDRSPKWKNYNLLLRTAIVLLLVNITFFIIDFVLFSGGLSNFLISSITFTVVYSGVMFFRYKRGLE
ncbi:hypothetical protein M948_14775 [Virgibacillus sp. CM-4]|uniref:Uncharacterized protein n=1 Tax=Virgibacillus massiliensis TaxID=1462526 RepID=A0A024QCU0_9BACI|nr:hypothetical protein [Virgibacillus salexigens]EQB36296.1 hypothetical protein M948_14775 [Virgibacillus sp. CM-4]CDQ39995.1 hypothetical protein BN990_02313 [Virgibacillus massiliensis]